MIKQIVALGGGGFSEEDNLILDEYILSLANKALPKVCFLPTASGDAQDYIDRFYKSFSMLSCETVHLSLFKDVQKNYEDILLGSDIIYVGGGNTRNMLTLWREWGVDCLLRQAWENGVVLAGISAGSICWFEQGVSDSIPGTLSALKCLGFLKGSNCPHFDKEQQRRPAYHALLKDGHISPGIATDNGVGLHFIDGNLYRVISSSQNARAYRVNIEKGEPTEKEIIPEYLGVSSKGVHNSVMDQPLLK